MGNELTNVINSNTKALEGMLPTSSTKIFILAPKISYTYLS